MYKKIGTAFLAVLIVLVAAWLEVSGQTHIHAVLDAPNAFTGNNTHSGTETFIGALIATLIKNFGNARYVDGFTSLGAALTDCLADPLCPGVNATTQGGGTIAAAISVGSLIQPIYLNVGPGTWTTSGTITVNASSAIHCVIPQSSSPGASPPPACIIKAANASNLPSVVLLAGAGATLDDIVVDANKANNPTGGVAVKVNLANRIRLSHLSAQNAPTHGVWFVSTLTGKESCCAEVSRLMSINNNGDGIFAQNTSDLEVGGTLTELENNGLSAVVNTSGTLVTWVSGTQWSTDSSLVGTTVRINGVLYTVASVASGTSLTLGVTAGTQTSVALNWGNGFEGVDSPTIRFSHVDFGGNKIDGLLARCTATGLGTNAVEVGGATQFGNQFQSDIEVLGSDLVTGAPCAGAFGTTVVATDFIGSANRTPNNTWSNIRLSDGGQHIISANFIASSSSPNQSKCGIEIGETVSGRAVGSTVSFNSFNSNFGTQNYCDSTLNGGFANQIPVRGGAGSNATLDLFDVTTGALTPHKFLRVSSGGFQIVNSGFSGVMFTIPDAAVLTAPAVTDTLTTNAASQVLANKQVNGAAGLLLSQTAPTISSGFGTAPTIASNGSASFTINVGTGGTATSGVIGLPAAVNGWNVFCNDLTTFSTSVFVTRQTATTTTTATIGNFTSAAAAGAWAASDILSCVALAR